MALKITSFERNLFRLIERNEKREEVESAIQRRNLYNAVDKSNNTLLHIAAKSKNTAIVKYLIESGITVDLQNDLGQTPLMLAIASGYVEIVEVLMEASSNTEAQDNNGKTVLEMIGKCNWLNEKILRLFLQKLQSACSNVKEEIAKKLALAHWPVHKVVQLKDADLMKIMLQRGYLDDIDATDRLRQTALHKAVKYVDVEIVKLLLKSKADVNIVDLDRRTPLLYVYAGGANYPNERLNILKMLLDNGAVLMSGYLGATQGGYDMFKYGNREAIKLLLQADEDLFFRRSDWPAVVHALVSNTNPGALDELDGAKNFSISLIGLHGAVFLNAAVAHKNADSVEYLLSKIACTDAADETPDIFKTVLRYHAIKPEREEQSKKCVQVFLERGVNVQLETDNSTILGVILDKKFFLLGELVLSHLALQETLGTTITELTRIQIISCDRFKTYYEASKQRLSMEIYGSITLFHLLTESDEKLERYVCNEELVSMILDVDYTSLYSYYYFRSLLQKRITKANASVTLKKRAANIICRIMQMGYESFPFIADKIVNYLEQQDIKNLIDASV